MGNDDRELGARQRAHNLKIAQSIAQSLMLGDREIQVTGYGPTPATTIAAAVVVDEDMGELHAHVLGFHDAMLRDGGGYKVPEGLGAAYEEGHRLGAEHEREGLMPAPREVQAIES